MKSFSQRLEKWRGEPESKRERRALAFAIAITLILFVLWLGSFRLVAVLRTSPSSNSNQQAEVVETEKISTVVDRIKAGWQTITQ